MQAFRRSLHALRSAPPSMASFIVACLVLVTSSTISFCQEEVLPPQVKDIKMASSSAEVIDKIGSVGTYSKVIDPKDQRMKLTWQVPPNNPYYENLTFGFTEKDRLYLIRFTLRKDLRQDFQTLKKAFFEKFRISGSEPPMKMRIKGQEMLTYISENGGNHTFFEFTDVQTGEKRFEVFDRAISAQDKPTLKKEDDKEKKADQDKK